MYAPSKILYREGHAAKVESNQNTEAKEIDGPHGFPHQLRWAPCTELWKGLRRAMWEQLGCTVPLGGQVLMTCMLGGQVFSSQVMWASLDWCLC